MHDDDAVGVPWYSGRKILSISPFAHSFSRVLFLVLSISLALVGE